MITLEQAIELATEAHKNQWRNVALYQSTQTIDEVRALYPNDKFEQTFLANVYNRSKPYITHPLAVMKMMNTDEENRSCTSRCSRDVQWILLVRICKYK